LHFFQGGWSFELTKVANKVRFDIALNMVQPLSASW